MTCFTAQSMIIKYLNNELSDEELMEFLDHVDNCDDCHEELEIYYTIITGMKQLDEDKVLTSNFHKALDKKLQSSHNMLVKRQKNHLRKAMMLCFIFLIMPVTLCFESSQRDDKDVVVYTDAKRSNYELKYYFDKDRENKLSQYVDEHRDDMFDYVNKGKMEEYSEK